jgi:hypothetical protein
MSRDLNPEEINLTQQDIAYKQAVLTEVEAKIREILPSLVTACIDEQLGLWIDQTVEMVNRQEQVIVALTAAVFPQTEELPDADSTDPDVK